MTIDASWGLLQTGKFSRENRTNMAPSRRNVGERARDLEQRQNKNKKIAMTWAMKQNRNVIN